MIERMDTEKCEQSHKAMPGEPRLVVAFTR